MGPSFLSIYRERNKVLRGSTYAEQIWRIFKHAWYMKLYSKSRNNGYMHQKLVIIQRHACNIMVFCHTRSKLTIQTRQRVAQHLSNCFPPAPTFSKIFDVPKNLLFSGYSSAVTDTFQTIRRLE